MVISIIRTVPLIGRVGKVFETNLRSKLNSVIPVKAKYRHPTKIVTQPLKIHDIVQTFFVCLLVCLFVCWFFCVSCTFDLVWHEELLFGTNWMVQMSHDRTRMDYCILNSSMFHLKLVHTFVVHVEHKMNWLNTTISDCQNYAEILDKTSVISFNLTNPWTWMYYFATESYLGLLATFFGFYTFLIYLNLKNVHKVVLFCWR